MLGPIIMVGCGGSGIKSVRYVRESIRARLAARGWDGPMPAAWQFIGLDTLAGQTDLAEVPPLPSRDYLQISSGFRTLSDLYRHLRAAHPHVSRGNPNNGYNELLGWLPSSDELKGDLTIGAGKLRGVGRALGTYALNSGAIKNRFTAAFTACESELAELELACQTLGIPVPTGSPMPPPLVLVIGSSAGGTGAGIMLDTMDMLRRLGSEHITPAAIVYGPDIFGQGKGVEDQAPLVANSLGFMSEMMSAFWAKDSGPVGLFPAPLAPITDRGPYAVFLVGRKNMAGTDLSNSETLYRAVGETLSSWVTSESVHTEVVDYIMANKYEGQTMGGTGFGDTHFKGGVTSFGAASIAVGRSRFRSYAKAFLMRNMYEFHWNGAIKEVAPIVLSPTEATKVQSLVYDDLAKHFAKDFLTNCGLAQTFDADGKIGRGMFDDVFSAEDSSSTGKSFQALLESKLPTTDLDASNWMNNLRNFIDLHRPTARKTSVELFESKRTNWIGGLPERVLVQINELIAEASLPIAILVLDKAIAELQVTASKYHAASDFARAKSTSLGAEMWAGVQRITGKVKRDSGAVKAATTNAGGVHSQDLTAEFLLRMEDATLSIIKNLITPAKNALVTARDGDVALITTEQHDRSAIVTQWPTGTTIPGSFLPSMVEFLLESPENWPGILEELVRNCVSPRSGENQWQGFRRSITMGDLANDATNAPLLWSRDSDIKNWNGSFPLSLRARMDLESIENAVNHWMTVNPAIANHLSEGLSQYLADESQVLRLQTFKTKFQQALQQSKPLIEINQNGYQEEVARIKGGADPIGLSPVIDRLPFQLGHPARPIAEDLLRSELNLSMTEDMRGYFTDSERESSVMSAFLSGFIHPSFVNTFTEPIALQLQSKGSRVEALRAWFQFKRARTIDEFIPVPNVILKAMIRGFAVGRVLGLVTATNTEAVSISEGSDVHQFPFPLLSPVQASDILPGLLESFSLTFGSVPTKKMDAYAAYRALYKLGVSEPGNDQPLSFGVALELKNFLDNGIVNAEIVDRERFDRMNGETFEIRKENVLAQLNALVAHYQTLKTCAVTGHEMRSSDGTIDPMNTISIEIAGELESQYVVVRDAIEKYVPGARFGDGVVPV